MTIVRGGGGTDTMTGGEGNDAIDGGAGNDTVTFGGPSSEYTIDITGGTVTVTDNNLLNGDDGIDTLTDVETLDFSGANVLIVGAGGFATIQEAVDAAGNGDTIMIAEGTYTEQVQIDGKTGLTLVGLGEVTIKAPADVVETARSSSDREMHSVVTIENSTGITLDNVNVDGDGRANTIDEGGGAGQAQFTGVFVRNSTATLEDVDITGVRDPLPGGTTTGTGDPIVSGNQRGVALQVDNDTLMAFTMTGGSISDFQKNATVFSFADLNVTGVTITGGGDQPVNAQNGIQVLNSTGTIANNIITNIGYAGPQLVYSGMILAYGNTDLDITGNTITGTNGTNTGSQVVGIYILDFGTDNSGGSITGNIISHVDEGIDVSGGLGPNGMTVSGNSVTNLDLSDPYVTGVYFAPTTSAPVDVSGSEGDDVLLGGCRRRYAERPCRRRLHLGRRGRRRHHGRHRRRHDCLQLGRRVRGRRDRGWRRRRRHDRVQCDCLGNAGPHLRRDQHRDRDGGCHGRSRCRDRRFGGRCGSHHQWRCQ